MPRLDKKIKQYHVYFYDGRNLLQDNKIPNWETVWYECFKELFNPTDLLQNLLRQQPYKENEYCAVHLRFANALGRVESGYNNSLESIDKKRLIESCISSLNVLKKEHKLLIFSDSEVFLSEAQKAGFDVLDGKIGHISFSDKQEIAQKMLIDFFMISRAQKVFQILSKQKSNEFLVLFTSGFPKYAALVENKPFERVYID
jgi:hypothetical protein